jgi:DNA-binding Lrp family transcriptional regulator
MDGGFNLKVQLIAKNMLEVHRLWEDIFEKYVNYIEKRRLTIVTRNYYYYRPYLLEMLHNTREQIITTPANLTKLEKLDLGLLRILARGARTSVLELSSSLDITPKTVIAHMKSLREKKIIQGYGLSVDLEKMGYQIFRVAFILARLTPKKFKDFQDYVKDNPNIVYDEEVVGGDDYEIEVQVRDVTGLRALISDIQSKFSDIIQDYQILHVFKTYRGLTFPESI